MSIPERLDLQLELEVGSDPIVGSLSATGRTLTFSGWVGLASALEQMISAGPAREAGEAIGREPPSAELRRLP